MAEIDQVMNEALVTIVEYIWYIINYIVGVLITAFVELVVDYMTGKILRNVEFMTFGLIIVGTALILYLRFVAN